MRSSAGSRTALIWAASDAQAAQAANTLCLALLRTAASAAAVLCSLWRFIFTCACQLPKARSALKLCMLRALSAAQSLQHNPALSLALDTRKITFRSDCSKDRRLRWGVTWKLYAAVCMHAMRAGP